MTHFTQLFSSSPGKKYIMAFSGLLLGCFLCVHAAGNSSLFWGRKAFLSYAEHLHSLGILIPVAEMSLAVVFLLHISVGLLLFLQNNNARTSRYAVQNSAGGRTWGSRTMPYTGFLLLIFIIFHLFNFHFTDKERPIADIVTEILTKPLYFMLYFTGMTALGLHLSHGFWSIFQTIGLNHPLYNRLIRNGSLVITSILFLIFSTILLLLLTNNNFLTK